MKLMLMKKSVNRKTKSNDSYTSLYKNHPMSHVTHPISN